MWHLNLASQFVFPNLQIFITLCKEQNLYPETLSNFISNILFKTSYIVHLKEIKVKPN